MADNDEKLDVLAAYEEKIRDKRLQKALKPIRTSVSLLFLIGILTLVVAIINLCGDTSEIGNIINFAFVAVYIGLYFSSKYYPFISILMGTLFYGTISLFSILSFIWRYSLGVATGIHVSFIIISLIRLIILFFLIKGIVYAKKYEGLTKEA